MPRRARELGKGPTLHGVSVVELQTEGLSSHGKLGGTVDVGREGASGLGSWWPSGLLVGAKGLRDEVRKGFSAVCRMVVCCGTERNGTVNGWGP